MKEESILKKFDIKDKKGKVVFTVKMGNEENPRSQIYINNWMVMTCHFVPINIPTNELEKTNEIESINDLIDNMDLSNEGEPPNPMYSNKEYKKVAAELDFFVNCSNLQAWVENDYDTRLLDYRLSFPLLKALADTGDLVAQQRFKEEIVKRAQTTDRIRRYILEEGYLHYFKGEDRLLFYQTILKENEALGVYQLESLLKIHFLVVEFSLETRIGPDIHSTCSGFLEIKEKRVIGLQILDSPSLKIWDFIKNFSKLERLNLSGKLRHIPEWISELKSLQNLKIHNSDLEKVADSIGNLPQLIRLGLNNNRIKEIPKTIGNLTELIYLDISNNKYDSLPNELINLKELRIFNYDKIHNLPKDFDYLIRNYLKNLGYTEYRWVDYFGHIQKSWQQIILENEDDKYDREAIIQTLKGDLDGLTKSNNRLEAYKPIIIEKIFPKIFSFTGNEKVQSRNIFLEIYEKKIKKFLKANALLNNKNSTKEFYEAILKELEDTMRKHKLYIKIDD